MRRHQQLPSGKKLEELCFDATVHQMTIIKPLNEKRSRCPPLPDLNKEVLAHFLQSYQHFITSRKDINFMSQQNRKVES